RINRIRIGATGLAFIVLVVLLAISISGTASNEPELTPEAIAEQEAIDGGAPSGGAAQPQEPLAELGVAPAAGPIDGPEAADGAGEPPGTD
ncbi:MAG: hypothetical protein ABR601_02065, partial [Parasphingopyxis sp.]